jgi:transcriptional regulator with XRE-family HTH domain
MLPKAVTLKIGSERQQAHSLSSRASDQTKTATAPAELMFMPEPAFSVSKRFRELRERAGLSENEAGQKMGISVWDIEAVEDELTSCHSAADIRKFCQVLNARPSEVFDITTTEPAVSAEDLVSLIQSECQKRGVTLEQFEDSVGWYLSRCMEPPERLLEDMSVDGLQWLCRELGIHWHRVILSL